MKVFPIDKETYIKDYEKYHKEITILKNPSSKKEEKKDLTSIEKILKSNTIIIYNKLSIENKRKFWLSFIDKIYIENGKIKEVTFL